MCWAALFSFSVLTFNFDICLFVFSFDFWFILMIKSLEVIWNMRNKSLQWNEKKSQPHGMLTLNCMANREWNYEEFLVANNSNRMHIHIQTQTQSNCIAQIFYEMNTLFEVFISLLMRNVQIDSLILHNFWLFFRLTNPVEQLHTNHSDVLHPNASIFIFKLINLIAIQTIVISNHIFHWKCDLSAFDR